MEILLFLWPYHELDWEDHQTISLTVCVFYLFIYLFITLPEVSPSKYLDLVHQVFAETAVSEQHMEES